MPENKRYALHTVFVPSSKGIFPSNPTPHMFLISNFLCYLVFIFNNTLLAPKITNITGPQHSACEVFETEESSTGKCKFLTSYSCCFFFNSTASQLAFKVEYFYGETSKQDKKY
jgi:hypothetical protein